VCRYLTDEAHFDRVPPFAGAIEYVRDNSEPATLAILQGLVANQGDGWTWAIEELDRYYEACSPLAFPAAAVAINSRHVVDLSDEPIPDVARDHLGLAVDAAARLGRRTGEMHAALAAATSPAFKPVPLSGAELTGLSTALRDHGARCFDRLRMNLSTLPDDLVEQAGLALGRRRSLLTWFDRVSDLGSRAGWRTRIHGDYHLGQVLRSRNDFVILDFEGEPTRPLTERRSRHSPVKDLAGMLRSFSYAAWTGLLAYTTRRPEAQSRLEPWARLWEQSTGMAFLQAWREATRGAAFIPADAAALRTLLEAYVLDKVLYELIYELDNRPTWVRVPLGGILALEENR
jgi:maltose alpha-D-glucosyltransferase/alpha-amylase